jgi:methyl coenzyme M reductase gamma subunit
MADIINFINVRICENRHCDHEQVATITFETDTKSPSKQSLFVRTVTGSNYEILSNGQLYKCVQRSNYTFCDYIPNAYLEFLAGLEYVRIVHRK